ncbi:MAG: sulfite exporter TauE/SafE family protein [Acidobacteria bacterium]|nr:sulfite exporter TauE/SafE family protein [Acidobacteriota bacterium]
MTIVLAGLALGLAGSGHCGAMCGPLVWLANPRRAPVHGVEPSAGQLAVHVALYHAGRASTYVALGLVAGLAGGAMARLGLGRAMAIVAGVVLVLQALAAARILSSRGWSAGVGARVTVALGRIGAWMRTHRVQGPLLFGALNGLLPCGLLYAALLAAAGLGSVRDALVFMAAFAVGTTPVLAALGIAGGAIAMRVPDSIRRAAPYALALVGVLLIARGISPERPHTTHTTPAAAHNHR